MQLILSMCLYLGRAWMTVAICGQLTFPYPTINGRTFHNLSISCNIVTYLDITSLFWSNLCKTVCNFPAPKICQKYIWDVPEKYLINDWNICEICQSYIWDIIGDMCEICARYAWDMLDIYLIVALYLSEKCERYFWDMS